jgi:hypothetical protein
VRRKENIRNGDLNYGKIEYLDTDHSEEFQINGNLIPVTEQYKCFGSTLQGNGQSDTKTEKSY